MRSRLFSRPATSIVGLALIVAIALVAVFGGRVADRNADAATTTNFAVDADLVAPGVQATRPTNVAIGANYLPDEPSGIDHRHSSLHTVRGALVQCQHRLQVICALRDDARRVVRMGRIHLLEVQEPAQTGVFPTQRGELEVPLASFIRDTAHAVVDALGIEKKDVIVEGLANRWQQGTLVMQSADTSLQSKEVPLETFFHKIVMIRNNLRVLEQKVNASDKLTDADKVELQQYITRCYGSLTTFNILFKNKEEQF